MNNTIAQEPWVRLETEQDFKLLGRDDTIAANQQLRQSEKHRFYRMVFDMLKANNVHGDYLEFGCHRGRTFRMALTEARRQELGKMRFHAFDSFQGLPDDDSGHDVDTYVKGSLKTEESAFMNLMTEHGIFPDRIRTHKGFYQDSLNPRLQTELINEGTQAALICVDCDLIASTTAVFDFIAPFLQEGAIIYIDDYYAGYKGNPARSVAKTWHKFVEDNKADWFFEDFLRVGWWGRSFIACK